MEHKAALKFLDEEINARYYWGEEYILSHLKRRYSDFIVGSSSYIEGDCQTVDSTVHIEGHYLFGSDLELHVVGGGIWDYKKSTHQKSSQFRSNVGDVKKGNKPSYPHRNHEHGFREYSLKASILTSNEEYLRASESFIFSGIRFSNGESDFRVPEGVYWKTPIHSHTTSPGHIEMFTMIRLFGAVGPIIMEFVDSDRQDELDKTLSELEEKISELKLDRLPIEYQTAYIDLTHEPPYRPVATAHHKDEDTGIEFKVVFSPLNEIPYFWTLIIPSDVPQDLYELCNKRIGIPTFDELSTDADGYLFEDAFFIHTKEGEKKYHLDGEEIFLKCFLGWERVLHRLKHGKPKELGLFEEGA